MWIEIADTMLRYAMVIALGIGAIAAMCGARGKKGPVAWCAIAAMCAATTAAVCWMVL